ncbi:hypothetical protein HPB50_016281 [Hyalomma asiaticum]|uniref:Uncharacterized protein n=1 Tax=Hyalomma asiaticum TaxID=266040 RepID=A0ACB7SIJ3_HYAAI|nr:hypothetical protein HPB50_016281 [Hyalomma asiaticum]
MSEQCTQMAHEGALGEDSLMWLDMVPTFTGDGAGTDIHVFFKVLEQAGRLGGWQDSHLICIARCKMTGSAHAFAWQDVDVACATTYRGFKDLALRRFDSEPISAKLERFINARQNFEEGVRAFADRVRILGTATLEIVRGEDPAKTQLRREILAEQLLARFVAGLSDPVRRFVLSHDPQTFDEAVEVAAREEQIERSTKLRAPSACHVRVEEQELENRLNRLEKLVEKRLGLHEYERDIKEEQRRSRPPPSRGDDYSQLRHTAQECNWQPQDPWSEAISCQSTDGQNVEGIAERLEVSSVRGLIEEKALISVVDICGERSALAEAGEEIEKLDRKCQAEEASENAQVRESGAEASSSCDAPQSATQTDEESGDDRVGAPFEIESEPVTGGGFTAKEVVFCGSEESSEMQTTPVTEELRGSALLESEMGLDVRPQEGCALVGSERQKEWTMTKSVTRRRGKATGGGRSTRTSVKRLAMVDEHGFSACEVAAISPLVGEEVRGDYFGKREVPEDRIRDWQL